MTSVSPDDFHDMEVLTARLRGRVLVADPGLLNMNAMAAGLSRAGMLRGYVAPITASGPLRHLARLPGTIGRRFRRELMLRPVPDDVSPMQVGHEASFTELLAVGSGRLGIPPGIRARLIARRNVIFDRNVSRRLRADDAAVISSYGAALRTFRRAAQLGVTSFLEYPFTPHGYTETLLSDEARRQPEFAVTLPPHQPSGTVQEALNTQLDAELDLADWVFALSTFHKRSLILSGVPEEKLLLMPLGIDLTLFQPQPRVADGVFRVVFVGQITQRKGISYLFEAFARAAIPNAELLLVGNIVGSDAPWRRYERVRHVPHVPRYELPEQYATVDVLILPSLIEAFPLTALEAMACGVPVIVSEHTFGTDVVTDGVDGYVVPIRDATAIAKRMRYMYEHPSERTRMGVAARRRAEDFSWDRYGERIADAVRKALSSTERGH